MFGSVALKAWLGVLATVVMAVGGYLTDNVYTGPEIVATVMVFLGTVGVWVFPDTWTGVARASKFIAMLLTGALGTLLTLWADGNISGSDIAQIVIAGLAAVGIGVVSNPGYVPVGKVASPPVGP